VAAETLNVNARSEEKRSASPCARPSDGQRSRAATTFVAAGAHSEYRRDRARGGRTTGLQSLHTGKSRPSINQPFAFVILESRDTQ
jgi:hypothetical protein